MHDTILSIDPGRARTGLAVGNTLFHTVTPLYCLSHRSDQQRAEALRKEIREWQITHCLIGFADGHPSSGRTSTATQEAMLIAQHIREETPHMVIHFIDEAFSSTAAESLLKQHMSIHKKNKHHIDIYAACILLQAFFNGNPTISYDTILAQQNRSPWL